MNPPDIQHTREEPFPVSIFILFALISALVCFVLFSNCFNESLFRNLVQARGLMENGLAGSQLTAPGWTKLLSYIWRISPESILLSRCLSFAGHLLALFYLMRFISLLTGDRFWAYFAGLLWSVDPIFLSDTMLLSGGGWFSALLLAGFFHYLQFKNGSERSFYFSSLLFGCSYLFLISSWIISLYIFVFLLIGAGKVNISKRIIAAIIFLLPFLTWNLSGPPESSFLMMWPSVIENQRFIADPLAIVIRCLLYFPLLIGLAPLFFTNIKPSESAIRPSFWIGLLLLSLSCTSLFPGGELLLITSTLPIILLALFCDSMTRLRIDGITRKFPRKISDLYPIPYFVPVLLVMMMYSLMVGYFIFTPYQLNYADYYDNADFEGSYARAGALIREYAGDNITIAGPQPYTLSFFSGLRSVDIFKMKEAAVTGKAGPVMAEFKPEIIIYPLYYDGPLAIENVFPELVTPGGDSIIEPISQAYMLNEPEEDSILYCIYYCHWNLKKIDVLLEMYKDEISGLSVEDKEPDSPVEGED